MPTWTRRRCEIFFAGLAEVCNVWAAALAAGFADRRAAYNQRRHDPEFRACWDEAIAEGWVTGTYLLSNQPSARRRGRPVKETIPRERVAVTI